MVRGDDAKICNADIDGEHGRKMHWCEFSVERDEYMTDKDSEAC